MGLNSEAAKTIIQSLVTANFETDYIYCDTSSSISIKHAKKPTFMGYLFTYDSDLQFITTLTTLSTLLSSIKIDDLDFTHQILEVVNNLIENRVKKIQNGRFNETIILVNQLVSNVILGCWRNTNHLMQTVQTVQLPGMQNMLSAKFEVFSAKLNHQSQEETEIGFANNNIFYISRKTLENENLAETALEKIKEFLKDNIQIKKLYFQGFEQSISREVFEYKEIKFLYLFFLFLKRPITCICGANPSSKEVILYPQLVLQSSLLQDRLVHSLQNGKGHIELPSVSPESFSLISSRSDNLDLIELTNENISQLTKIADLLKLQNFSHRCHQFIRIQEILAMMRKVAKGSNINPMINNLLAEEVDLEFVKDAIFYFEDLSSHPTIFVNSLAEAREKVLNFIFMTILTYWNRSKKPMKSVLQVLPYNVHSESIKKKFIHEQWGFLSNGIFYIDIETIIGDEEKNLLVQLKKFLYAHEEVKFIHIQGYFYPVSSSYVKTKFEPGVLHFFRQNLTCLCGPDQTKCTLSPLLVWQSSFLKKEIGYRLNSNNNSTDSNNNNLKSADQIVRIPSIPAHLLHLISSNVENLEAIINAKNAFHLTQAASLLELNELLTHCDNFLSKQFLENIPLLSFEKGQAAPDFQALKQQIIWANAMNLNQLLSALLLFSHLLESVYKIHEVYEGVVNKAILDSTIKVAQGKDISLITEDTIKLILSNAKNLNRLEINYRNFQSLLQVAIYLNLNILRNICDQFFCPMLREHRVPILHSHDEGWKYRNKTSNLGDAFFKDLTNFCQFCLQNNLSESSRLGLKILEDFVHYPSERSAQFLASVFANSNYQENDILGTLHTKFLCPPDVPEDQSSWSYYAFVFTNLTFHVSWMSLDLIRELLFRDFVGVYRNPTISLQLKYYAISSRHGSGDNFKVSSYREDLMKLIASLPHLTFLDLSGCEELTDHDIHILSYSKSLQYLNLKDCKKLTDVCLIGIAARLKNIKYLNLKGCPEISSTTSTLSMFQHIPVVVAFS